MAKKPVPLGYLPVDKNHKFCFRCSTVKPLDDFYIRYTLIGSKTHASQCKKCSNALTRADYQLNREYYILQKRDYYKRKKRLEKVIDVTTSEAHSIFASIRQSDFDGFES